MHIRELRLQTGQLAEQKVFYREKLGLPFVSETHVGVTIQCGETQLTFVQTQDNSKPFYHFAFNISENKLLQAKAWLAERHIALSQDDPDNMYSSSWNSHALYFYDAGGNIVEFIARHSLPTAQTGSFTAHDILYASEIGLVTANVLAMSAQLKQTFGVGVYKDGESDTFASLGDELGLFIVVKRERVWLASNKQAQVFPTEMMLIGECSGTRTFDATPFPYQIRMQDTHERIF